MKLRHLIALPLVVLATVTGCSLAPTYVDDGQTAGNNLEDVSLNPVHYKIEDGLRRFPPSCVAVLPLKNATAEEVLSESDKKYKLIELTDESLEQLRWSLYPQLAPYAYRDVELALVNQAMEQSGQRTDFADLGRRLNCDALLLGEVTEYQSGFFGIYSQTSIGVKLKLIRASSQEVLWKGHHVATNRGGSFPLTPVDIIMGFYSATENLSDEQLVRVRDDVFRRLLSTWSDTDTHQTDVPEEPKPVISQYPFNIAVKHLYLRSGPSTKYKPVAVLDQQDRIAIVDKKSTPWVGVEVENGPSGYVNAKYLKKTRQADTVALLDKASVRHQK